MQGQPNPSIQVAVIGTGSISESHLQAYANHPNVHIAALCDLNEERAGRAAEKYKVPQAQVYTDYRELLQNKDIQAVSICTWNNTHAEIAIEALRQGKHVLVEKPLCKTVAEALQVEEAVHAFGKILQIGYVRRYEPRAQMVQRFAADGEFGEIYYAKASLLRRLGNPGGWFADKERSGGGPLIDIGVHIIDLCWYLMGRPKPVAVSGCTHNKLGNRANVQHLSSYKAADYRADLNTVEDLAHALIRFDNGASLSVEVSFTLHAKEDRTSVALFGDKGGVELDPEVVMVTEKHDTIMNLYPQMDSKGFDFSGAFQGEIDHFIDCVVTGKQPISPIEDGVEMMRILCAIYESAALGSEVRLG
ncbi:Gfo/Idh/MocA family protein [Paenibacillus sp. GCM10023252]|uniref:Gfo/Idh/MocA family protein n=1 Tax=Paenibacillus sp. GCM10023252 TaxID=3252649 RepID=UPI003610A4E2